MTGEKRDDWSGERGKLAMSLGSPSSLMLVSNGLHLRQALGQSLEHIVSNPVQTLEPSKFDAGSLSASGCVRPHSYRCRTIAKHPFETRVGSRAPVMQVRLQPA